MVNNVTFMYVYNISSLCMCNLSHRLSLLNMEEYIDLGYFVLVHLVRKLLECIKMSAVGGCNIKVSRNIVRESNVYI